MTCLASSGNLPLDSDSHVLQVPPLLHHDIASDLILEKASDGILRFGVPKFVRRSSRIFQRQGMSTDGSVVDIGP